MRKKALILTYYFPPCNFIGANRPHSWAENFLAFGIYPTIITRHWKGDEKYWIDYQQDSTEQITEDATNSYRIFRLPYQKKQNRISKKLLKGKLFSKLYHFCLVLSGNIHSELNAYDCFRDFLYKHLQTNSYDYLVVTSPPINIIRLGSKVSKEFNIPLIVDFRDLWDNNVLSATAKISLKSSVINAVYKMHIKRWLTRAKLCVSVSQPLLDEIRKLSLCPLLVVTNGFEKELFARIEKKHVGEFTISFIGTLYPNQRLDILLKGIQSFLKDKQPGSVVVNFIGTATLPEVKEIIERELPSKFIFITDRVKRSEALTYMKNSHILFHAAWSGYKGIYSSKLFEYLGAGRNILIAPGDNDVIDQVIKDTRAGKISNNAQEVKDALEEWYEEWKVTGKVHYHGVKDNIEHFTRENQTKKLVDQMLHLI